MSMCMYLRRVSDAEAMRYRREPETVLAATLGVQFGGQTGPLDFDSLFGLDGLDEAFGRPRGFFGWLKAWLIKRALRAVVRRQVEHLDKARAAMGQALAGDGPVDIPSPDALVDLHKSWHILHYALTGTPESGLAPLNVLLVGGEEVGEDLGYGPARLIDPQAMADFARALRDFDLQSLVGRLDVERMAASGIYCVDEDDDPQAQLSELEADLRRCFPALRSFADKAAASRHGALVWIS